jgi:hypothetical protein
MTKPKVEFASVKLSRALVTQAKQEAAQRQVPMYQHIEDCYTIGHVRPLPGGLDARGLPQGSLIGKTTELANKPKRGRKDR